MPGYYTTIRKIKPDAKPIDNITKFAWDDDDYIDEQVWVEITIKEQVEELKAKLNDTDYIFAHAVEDLLGATSIVEILKVLKSYATEYKTVIEDRKSWRKQIEELENK